ncbi:MAG: bile acid:sodium symporter family protein [Verrucomicrobiae bacterium]|nr:bile acid:sodium symporter family protein [Verrucomicrobiae bacterium]
MGTILIIGLVAIAVWFTRHPALKSYAFTTWVFVFVATSMVYPAVFGTWFGFDLKHLIVPLIQIIMFGMGTTLSLTDFTRVLAVPWAVCVGFVAQYGIMPMVGFGLTVLFNLEPEVAAGVVLIGSAPGGVASNVISYLARCNVALSVTMTAVSTLASPVMTPLMMKVLAGRYISISFFKMMMDILNMILVPVLTGLVANRILYGRAGFFERVRPLVVFSVVCIAAAIYLGSAVRTPLGGLKTGLIMGFVMLGVVGFAKAIVGHLVGGPSNWMDRALPVVSMTAICFIIGVITARSSEDLKRVGVAILAVSMMHNILGYTLGYLLARALGLNVVDSRTVAIEVGMQNGGMASGIAINTLGSAKAALAPAIFGPWQNVSGSILATWWRRSPPVTDQSYPAATRSMDPRRDTQFHHEE